MLLRDWDKYGIVLNSDEGFTDGDDDAFYPTNTALGVIMLWPPEDLPGLFAFIESIWWAADWGWHKNSDNEYAISTGGWSGNEDIIFAMKQNVLAWHRLWYQTRRGGHFIFRFRN